MSSSRFLSPLSLLSFTLLLNLATAYQEVSLCSFTTFSPSDPYNKTLNSLMSYLDSKTLLTGFGLESLSLNQSEVTSEAYGLALCRGDIDTTDCRACVDMASKEIRKVCQFNTEAIIYYDYCQLKYSYLDFFGQIDVLNWAAEVNPTNVSDPLYFNVKVIELLSGLVGKAAYESPKMYAIGELGIGNSTKLYGLVQCSRDLSSVDCEICLTAAITFIPQSFYGKVGGKQMGGSCSLRFEIYPFFNNA